jgi:ubiquinone/menaquinone biosynthesis C-methylase UbiE
MDDIGQSGFLDHFSERAPGYAIYRPTYPPELVNFLFDLIHEGSRHETSSPQPECPVTVWEAGCGSGQLTGALAKCFPQIIATDASSDQIAQAKPVPNVDFRVARADESGLADHSVDLAIAAQAAHWFDLNAYYEEVRRVVRPGGFVALITYGIHLTDNPEIDRVMKHFYRETLAAYWPPQRRFVEEGYRSLPFPFEEIVSPGFEMRAEWSLAEMLGYVESWSAVAALIKAKGKGRAQMDAFREELAVAWGAPESKRSIRWPLSMRLGRV